MSFKIMIPRRGNPKALLTAPAGNPAERPHSSWMSLDDLVSDNSKDTFYVHVEGESMRDRDIHHGDILVVHVKPIADPGNVVLARLGDELTIKTFAELEPYDSQRRLYLVPSNPDYYPLPVEERDDFQILGVVAYVLKRFAALALGIIPTIELLI